MNWVRFWKEHVKRAKQSYRSRLKRASLPDVGWRSKKLTCVLSDKSCTSSIDDSRFPLGFDLRKIGSQPCIAPTEPTADVAEGTLSLRPITGWHGASS
nr:hypothetical protein CFP56_09639 [Quercus suber]